MNETDILKEELKHYKSEKEKIRKIIGQIGGTTSIKHDRRVNIIFLVIVISLFLFDVLRELLHLQISGYSSNLAIELALLLVSVKIIWMINKQSKMDPLIRMAVEGDIGGDEQIINTMNVTYRDITFKHLLLPIWISAFKFKDKVYRFLVNARTGEVQGERPWSWLKILLAALAAAAVIGTVIIILLMYRNGG